MPNNATVNVTVLVSVDTVLDILISYFARGVVALNQDEADFKLTITNMLFTNVTQGEAD